MLVQLTRNATCSLLAALTMTLAWSASAQTVTTLRVMLHPYLAASGTLPPEALAHLEQLAQTSLTLTGTTRTGALELALPVPVDLQAANELAKRLKVDRGVLWAQPQVPRAARRESALSGALDGPPGQRLLLRLKDGVEPDWALLLPRLSERAGVELSVVRSLADHWVLSIPEKRPVAELAALAATLQQDADVRYADPVRRAYANAAPNDPYYAAQWSLHDPVSGVNVEPAWALQPSASGIVVAVIDTGILPHPDLVNRVLAGYDFISDPGTARDGDARDPDPRDEGDWSDGECGSAEDSFFHGLFVAGQIAANTNNGVGIAGMAEGVAILPVRVLGKCGGTFEDVLAGMLWASGVSIAGIPPNTTPAKVINLSLGGFGGCDQSLQAAVDLALTQGAVVVAAAGNESMDTSEFAPANCSGVITVGAHRRDGDITSYSNYGIRVDVSAPGGDRPYADLIVSLANDGVTVPQNSTYLNAAGTSFSAPLVSGTAAMMLARDPLLTAGRLLDIVTATAKNFPAGTLCAVGQICGAGMLDTGTAIASTIPGGPPPPGTVRVVEYYRPDLDHYFIASSPAEVFYVDTFLRGIFQRTGLYFYAYPGLAAAPAGLRPVCRFYADANVEINSHWYSADAQECAFVQATWPGIWNLEQTAAFYVQVPDASGTCPARTLPVYRFFNNRRDANHRYTVDLSVRRAMLNRAWAPEGYGPNSVVFCAAI